MDREFRNEQLRRANKKAIQRTVLLDDLDREYTLEEIAIVTRAGPARLLGLRDKGHLGAGADADVTHLRRPRGPRGDVRHAALRHQGRPRRGARRRARRGARPATLLRVAAVRPGGRGRPARRSSRSATRCASRTTRSRSRGCSSRRAGCRPEPRDDAAPRRGGRRHVRRGVRDVGRADRGHRRLAGVGADTPARSLTGFATSVIGCKCEAAIERELDAEETPDGRPGIAALLFAPDREGLGKRLVERVGQTVLTCPTTACFNGLDAERQVDVGGQLRFFGDGWQASKVLAGRALLADPGDGGRVPRRGALRDRRGRRRREHHHPRRGRPDRARRGGGGRRGDAGGGGRDHCRSRAGSRAAAARSARATRP